MITTSHLGEAGTHPVIASAARELLKKSENERSGGLSTSFLGVYLGLNRLHAAVGLRKSVLPPATSST